MICQTLHSSVNIVLFWVAGNGSRERETVQGASTEDREGETAADHCSEDGSEEAIAGERNSGKLENILKVMEFL